MKKILIVFGTRPEAIKLAPVIKELEQNPFFEPVVCLTGQHREMVANILALFNIIPAHNLDIMKHEQTLTTITSDILVGLEGVMSREHPAFIMVHGDTSTTLATALAAFYKKIPLVHIEAGLRTQNMYSPWPEEMNRKVTACLTSYHFAPTEAAKLNLLKENFNPKNIFVSGNTVIDAIHFALRRISEDTELRKSVISDLKGIDFSRKIVLITGHRRENLETGIFNLCQAIKTSAKKYREVEFVYPIHLNPKVQDTVLNILNNVPNVKLLPPLDYLQFTYLMSKSYLIVTDSGGIQEEAPSLSIPVLVTRDTTERPEGISSGSIKLVGTTQASIERNIDALFSDIEEYDRMAKSMSPFGDGVSSYKIVKKLEEVLNVN